MSAAGEASPVTPFGDRLAAAVAERESQVVLGIDPDPGKLWPDAVEGMAESRARLVMALADVERHPKPLIQCANAAHEPHRNWHAAGCTRPLGIRNIPVGALFATNCLHL